MHAHRISETTKNYPKKVHNSRLEENFGAAGSGERQARPTVMLDHGVRYTGQWCGNRRDGHGVQEWPDSARFEGPSLEMPGPSQCHLCVTFLQNAACVPFRNQTFVPKAHAEGFLLQPFCGFFSYLCFFDIGVLRFACAFVPPPTQTLSIYRPSSPRACSSHGPQLSSFLSFI